jgi:hypothetical protein
VVAAPMLLATAVAVVVSAAGRGTELPGYTPDWRLDLASLSSSAEVARGMALLESGDTVRAAAAAREALTRSPLDDRALELLVRVRDKEERWAEEKQLLALSSKLTKRNLPLRYMTMKMAEQDGNVNRAARDADLLLRQNAYPEEVLAVLWSLSARAEGRAAIVRRLEASPHWRASFIGGRGLKPASHDAAVEIVRLLKNSATPATVTEVAPLARTLIAAKATDAAARLRAVAAPEPSLPTLLDPRFERGDDPAGGLLGWRLPGQGGIEQPGAGVSIGLYGSGVVAEQILFLAPGRYLLRATLKEEVREGLSDLQWSATCLDGDQPLLGRTAIQRQSSQLRAEQSLSIPANCRAQRLTLYYTRVEGNGIAGQLLAASLTRESS